MSKKDKYFWESAKRNNASYNYYYNKMCDICISQFEWDMPDTIDVRYLELALYRDGHAIFFKDDVLGWLALRGALQGEFNEYNIPKKRTAYSANGYTYSCDDTNSVIIWNNYLRTPSIQDVELYADRLYNLDRAIDVNANAQKTPILIKCDEKQRLTLKNAYMQYDGNSPVIYASNNFNPNDGFNVFTTGAPYVADKLYELRNNIWNDFLMSRGISNNINEKRERLLSTEVFLSQGATLANRYSLTDARKEACKEINNKFGLNVSVENKEILNLEKEEKQDNEQIYDRN